MRNFCPLSRYYVVFVLPAARKHQAEAAGGVPASQGTGLLLHQQDKEAAGSECEILAPAGTKSQAQRTDGCL